MTSWNISPKQFRSCWQKEVSKSLGSITLCADQGVTTCLSLSDGQSTGKDRDGYDLKSIMAKLNRKKKGSKGYKRTQEQRSNYINWSINQLNLDNVKELRLEKLFQMRSGTRTSSFMNRWTYTRINASIKSKCEILGVHVIEQNAIYRSQRCSECGWTQKSNRKGKEFVCKSCGIILDADTNGALNHEADLYQLPYGLSQMKLNRTGFYWLETRIFDSLGQAITVPDENKLNMNESHIISDCDDVNEKIRYTRKQTETV